MITLGMVVALSPSELVTDEGVVRVSPVLWWGMDSDVWRLLKW